VWVQKGGGRALLQKELVRVLRGDAGEVYLVRERKEGGEGPRAAGWCSHPLEESVQNIKLNQKVRDNSNFSHPVKEKKTLLTFKLLWDFFAIVFERNKGAEKNTRFNDLNGRGG